MAEQVTFELVSPAKLLLSRGVEMVVVPGAEGDFGVLPRHAPMLSTLRPGVIAIYENGVAIEKLFVADGFADVNETSCTVLAEEATPVSEITLVEAKERMKQAQEAYQEADSDAARAAAERGISIAQAMLDAVA
jgi:F-type H+-transporting ATPase subunit epsilon